jgi:glycosyltransferase involved in cell wall biosynthesis
LPLVVAGGKGWGYEPILAEIDRLGLTDDVRLIGFADDLPALYNGAAALVYPSRYEGFGLPPLEAMACGTAVITSDATSLPEVVGDAGVLVNPDDVDGFTAAMGRVLADTGFRAELAAAGRERADRFTWKACAMGMVAVYRTALCVPMG